MRPLISNPKFCTRCIYAYCRAFASQSAAVSKFSLSISAKHTKNPKDKVKRVVRKYLKHQNLTSHDQAKHHAVILASQDFAAWLEDQSFIGTLLQRLYGASLAREDTSQIDILCGVVDGIPSTLPLVNPQRGLSILYSSTSDILPDLWDENSFAPDIEQENTASISFLSNPLTDDTRSLEVTLPLANTIFQNGRQSTLFASRWRKEQGDRLALATTRWKQTQRVTPGGHSVEHTIPFIPLLPLTTPRKILTGLGNILRQVEVDGSPAPASKELELLIPEVFAVRSKRYGPSSSGPIGVWAWVIPPHVIAAEILSDLEVFQADSHQSEAELATKAEGVFAKLTSSGCRLHKILSGGGGWGAKQGLLSLDPETSYAQSEQDDIEGFIKAFQERNSASPSEGIIIPGSYIIFCIEPHSTEEDMRSHRISPTICLGVAPTNNEGVALSDEPDQVKITEDHFGAASTAGLFLRMISGANESSATEGSEKTPRPFTTKINVPRACLSVGVA